jgi:hypothetical protein
VSTLAPSSAAVMVAIIARRPIEKTGRRAAVMRPTNRA